MAIQPSSAGFSWKWPGASRKAHVFADDEAFSLCGRWWFTGPADSPFVRTTSAGKDDCRDCWRRAMKASAPAKEA